MTRHAALDPPTASSTSLPSNLPAQEMRECRADAEACWSGGPHCPPTGGQGGGACRQALRWQNPGHAGPRLRPAKTPGEGHQTLASDPLRVPWRGEAGKRPPVFLLQRYCELTYTVEHKRFFDGKPS